jgi:hypothetical protein
MRDEMGGTFTTQGRDSFENLNVGNNIELDIRKGGRLRLDFITSL